MKRAIRLISLTLCVVLCLGLLGFPTKAENPAEGISDQRMSEVYENYYWDNPMMENYMFLEGFYSYWTFGHESESDDVFSWLMEKGSFLVGQQRNDEKYAEILSTLLSMQLIDLCNVMESQSEYDNLKSSFDYVKDIAGVATGILGETGVKAIEEFSPAIDALDYGIDSVETQLSAAQYFSVSLQDYTRSDSFLQAIIDYTDNPDLAEVASTMQKGNKELFQKRLEYISNAAESIGIYEGKFFVKQLSVPLLKETDAYGSSAAFKKGVDWAETIISNVGLGKNVFDAMMLIGNLAFGTTDTFNRYQEIVTLAEIADAIKRAKDQIPVPEQEDLTTAYDWIYKRCDLYRSMLAVHARGEYLMYQLMVSDAGLLSAFNRLEDFIKDSSETYEGIYEKNCRSLQNYSDTIHDIFITSEDGVEFNGHRYMLVDRARFETWDQARQLCLNRGGHLATITSAEENQFLIDYILSLGRTAAYFGYSDADSEGHWRWENDEQTNYANWFEGEPNNDKNGEHYALFYHADQTDQWNDGDFGVLSEGGRAFICEWDDLNRSPAETQTPVQTEAPTSPVSEERDVVLVLDTSGSMSGDPMSETKKAAVKFVQTVLPQNAGVGIVTFDSSASVVSGFSRDERALTDAINDIYDGGATNTEAGLSTAYNMLRQSNANKRIIVLMSDGMPNNGREGQDLIDYADSIKSDDVHVYTLGFFSALSEGEKISAQSLMEGIASDGCHYEVANADDLVFFFNDIADQINGQKYIYVRIACPVDVFVTYNGQTLSSSEENPSLRTDFGTLTFEQNEEDAENPDQDDRIKVLRLKEGTDYDVQIEGTGRGVMEYTIGFMNEDGKYSDFRTFRNVRITDQTLIDTVATVSEESILNVDEDGDGKYDVRFSAEANGYGKEIKTSKLPYIVIGADALFAVIIILIIMIRNHKNNKER